MASVLNSKARYYQYSVNGNEEAHHVVESEADIFIKEQLQKQRETNITLEEHLGQTKEFQSAHIYRPTTELPSGPLSYNQFKEFSYNLEVAKVAKSNASTSENTKTVSRHIRELALAVKPNSVETKLLEFAISCNAVGRTVTDTRPPEHPINNLNEIHDGLFGHLENNNNNPRKTAKTILRKRKQLLESMAEPTGPKEKTNQKPDSLWDVTDPMSMPSSKRKPKLYTCRDEKLFTIRDGKIVEYKGVASQPTKPKNEQIPSFISIGGESARGNVEISKRLSEKEIQQIPRFSNYEKGSPSQVLYLKNLSSNLEEKDLDALFSVYQELDKPHIVYTLMKKGKMRGQAFIDFHSVHAATKAMDEVNGAIIHDKPIIIQFGKDSVKRANISSWKL